MFTREEVLQERELSAHFAVLLTTLCFSVFQLKIWDFGLYIHRSDQPILQSENAAVFSEKAHTNLKCKPPAQVSSVCGDKTKCF